MPLPVCEVLLTENVLNPARLDGLSEAGAVIDFWGVVRGLEDGAEITGIEYEAHRTMAEHQLRMIAEEADKNFELRQLVIRHRIGFVAVGEASLFVRIGTGHRAEAFRASKWVVDELKQRATIWKHPRFKNEPANLKSARG